MTKEKSSHAGRSAGSLYMLGNRDCSELFYCLIYEKKCQYFKNKPLQMYIHMIT